MGNKSSRFGSATDEEDEREQPHNQDEQTSSSPSSSSAPSFSEPSASFRRRRSSLERRSTIPMELEDPEDCTVGESEAEYFPYIGDTSVATKQHEEDDDHDSVSAVLRQQLLKWPKEARNILAGGIAGIVAKSVVAPLDRIKILYQVSSAKFHLLDIPRAVQRIVTQEGFSALWKGNTATMIRIFPYSGIQFMVYDRIKHYFLHEQEHEEMIIEPPQERQQQSQQLTSSSGNTSKKWGLTPLESLVSGMIAGTVSVICTYPLDLTRAQLAVLKKKAHQPSQGFVSVLTDNYRCRGAQGLFRGIAPTLVGILPYSGVAFALNEQGKREIEHLAGREVTTVERIQCGALAGLVAQTLTYPIEVTRRRMQTIGIVGIHNDSAVSSALGVGAEQQASRQSATQTATATATARPPAPPTLVSTVKDLFAEQGIRGFMKGVSMNWLKGPVAFSISFTTFDHVQKWMESAKERQARFPPSRLSPTPPPPAASASPAAANKVKG